MNATIATITGFSLLVAERNMGLICKTLVDEVRPATFAAADTALAFASLARTSAWELNADGGVQATVAPVDNRFNGTVAARLDQAVGTTHEDFEVMFADQAQDGDLIGDMGLEGYAVVAGTRLMDSLIKIHMVSEGKTWADRYTTDFPRRQLVQVAHRKV